MTVGNDRPASFPFCCKRCRERDLGAWFAGRYTIAGEDPARVDQTARGVDRAPQVKHPVTE